MNLLKHINGINSNIWLIINIISFLGSIGITLNIRKFNNKYIKYFLYVIILLVIMTLIKINIDLNIFIEVPNVIGLDKENAKQTILENNLLFVVENENNNLHKIEKQDPEPGAYLKKNETVALYLEEFGNELLPNSNIQNNTKHKITEPLEEFPFRIEYNIIYPESKEIKVPTPEESGTFSIEIPLDLRAEEYLSDKVPTNEDIHGFVVNNLYYCSDDDSVTNVSKYNYYKFSDYWFYLHTIDISFMDFDDFEPNLNDARIVLQEKETQKRIVIQDNYLDGQFIQFKCSTGNYIIEVQKGNIAYTMDLNISKNEKAFLALSSDDYYYLSPNENDSYIDLEENIKESESDNEKDSPQLETIPESVLATIYDDDIQLLIDEGKYMEAINLYVSRSPEPTPENWCNVGDIFNYYIGDYDQAFLCYVICLENDSTYNQAYEGLDYAYEHGGSLDNFEWVGE